MFSQASAWVVTVTVPLGQLASVIPNKSNFKKN